MGTRILSDSYVKKGLPVKVDTLTLVSLDNKPVNVDALRIYTTATAAEPGVAELLKDFAALTDPADRLRAIRHLLWWLHQPAGQLPPAQVVAALDQVLKAAGSDEERDLVVTEMGHLATPEAVHCLEPLLAQAATRKHRGETICTIRQAIESPVMRRCCPFCNRPSKSPKGRSSRRSMPAHRTCWLLTGPSGCDPIAAMEKVYPPETATRRESTGNAWSIRMFGAPTRSWWIWAGFSAASNAWPS